MTWNVLDLKILQTKEFGNVETGKPVEFLGVFDQIFSEPELMIPLDPGDASASKGYAEKL